jgi:hypothetical protein
MCYLFGGGGGKVGGKEGEMTQTLYAHMNKKKRNVLFIHNGILFSCKE